MVQQQQQQQQPQPNMAWGMPAVPTVSNGASNQPPVMYTTMPQYQAQWNELNSDETQIKRIKLMSDLI